MRNPYVPLGLVFFLFACEAPTGPRINPNVDEARGSPVNPTGNPAGCLKKRAPAPSATAQSGFGATRIPSCTTEPGEDRGAYRVSGT
jgi:hypothetical protein